MKHLDEVLIEIAGANVLSGNCKDIEKLCKAVNYLSSQFAVQINTVCDDREYTQETIGSIRDHARDILTNK